jgi:hypothetical protein
MVMDISREDPALPHIGRDAVKIGKPDGPRHSHRAGKSALANKI